MHGMRRNRIKAYWKSRVEQGEYELSSSLIIDVKFEFNIQNAETYMTLRT